MSNFSIPIVQFDTYSYYNDEEQTIQNNTIILSEPLCTIKGLYRQDEGDELKCYQFMLYNEQNILIGGSNKIYSHTSPIFTCENLNDNSKYKLNFYCTSQSGNTVFSEDLIITTKYKHSTVYSHLIFGLDETNAKNFVAVEMVELTGTSNDDLTYINNEKVQVLGDRYINFQDQYNMISDNFLCRIWLEDIQQNMNILTIYNDNNDNQIIVKYYDNRFHAFKYSCGLVSHYISDEIIPNGSLYLALGHYNNRIELYAKNLT